jgi:hypothetical protein
LASSLCLVSWVHHTREKVDMAFRKGMGNINIPNAPLSASSWAQDLAEQSLGLGGPSREESVVSIPGSRPTVTLGRPVPPSKQEGQRLQRQEQCRLLQSGCQCCSEAAAKAHAGLRLKGRAEMPPPAAPQIPRVRANFWQSSLRKGCKVGSSPPGFQRHS